MQFPISLTLKIVSLAPQMTATDASGAPILYVRQKMFKFKEKIEIFTDASKSTRLGEINADRVIDFSANYTISDPDGNVLGAIRRKGMKSLWKAHYEITEGGALSYTLREQSAWTRVLDGLFSEIPVVGLFAGYAFHPVYDINSPDGRVHYRLVKKPAMFEGKFELQKVEATGEDDILVLLAVQMMVLLERARG